MTIILGLETTELKWEIEFDLLNCFKFPLCGNILKSMLKLQTINRKTLGHFQPLQLSGQSSLDLSLSTLLINHMKERIGQEPKPSFSNFLPTH